MPAPTNPSLPNPDASTGTAPASDTVAAVPAVPMRMRPPEEQGGHAVPELEHLARRLASKAAGSSGEMSAPQPSMEKIPALESSPEVEPIYLRPVGKVAAAAPLAAQAVDHDSGHISTPAQQAMITALTRSLGELLARGLPASVAAAVHSLTIANPAEEPPMPAKQVAAAPPAMPPAATTNDVAKQRALS